MQTLILSFWVGDNITGQSLHIKTKWMELISVSQNITIICNQQNKYKKKERGKSPIVCHQQENSVASDSWCEDSEVVFKG